MGKHSGNTDEDLRQKADQFDASHANPVQYAQDNFGASTNPDDINDARRGMGYDHR
jgi:hypothetical protein